MLSIVAIAGQPLMRYGLRLVCAESSAFTIVGEAASIRDGVRLVRGLQPDVTVLDMPRAKNLSAYRAGISELVDEAAAVLALLNPMPTSDLLELLRSGLAGVASRNADVTELRRALQIVGRGDLYGEVGIEETTQIRPRTCITPRLTEKEAQVLPLIASGLTNREIAHNLYVSETTAKFHVANLIRKFGANRRTELAYLAAQHDAF